MWRALVAIFAVSSVLETKAEEVSVEETFAENIYEYYYDTKNSYSDDNEHENKYTDYGEEVHGADYSKLEGGYRNDYTQLNDYYPDDYTQLDDEHIYVYPNNYIPQSSGYRHDFMPPRRTEKGRRGSLGRMGGMGGMESMGGGMGGMGGMEETQPKTDQCKDNWSNCDRYKVYCNRGPIMKNCKKTCRLCGVTSPLLAPETTSSPLTPKTSPTTPSQESTSTTPVPEITSLKPATETIPATFTIGSYPEEPKESNSEIPYGSNSEGPKDSNSESPYGSSSKEPNDINSESHRSNSEEAKDSKSESHYGPTTEVTGTPCSGQQCGALGGKCVKKSKDQCGHDVCGSRYFLSPCPCENGHCCCMPASCPARGSREYMSCAEAGGTCKFKDVKCDGVCLPLCGPSCSCCIPACTNLNGPCGNDRHEGTCMPECTGKYKEIQGAICEGPTCKCCGKEKGGKSKRCRTGRPCGQNFGASGNGDNSSSVAESGIMRKKCVDNEVVLHVISHDPICKCCLKDQCPPPHKKCQGGRGMCKPFCEASEYDDLRASIVECGGETTGCQCCIFQPCRNPKQMCKGNGRDGKCKAKCLNDEEPISLCDGYDGQCKCCAPKQCLVEIGSPCEQGKGLCKPMCDLQEKQQGKCSGPNCVCCVTPVCTHMGDKCSNGTGTCNQQCGPFEDTVSTCGGTQCFCCVQRQCKLPYSSCRGRGVCKPECSNQEEEVDKCDGHNCKCCAQKTCIAPNTPCGLAERGHCKEQCSTKEVTDLEAKCKGTNCQCCREKDCHFENKPCLNGRGHCRPECLSGEAAKEDKVSCTGTMCKCCVVQGCVYSFKSCGYGKMGKCKNKCEVFEDELETCEGESCKCCKEKDCHNKGCECGGDLNGTCKPSCDASELSISLCMGRNCQCCIRKVCDILGGKCGGDLDGQCKPKCLPGETRVGTCSGSNCNCCAMRPCEVYGKTCGKTGKGRCRNKCYSDEEVVGKCDGSNCHCCQLKVCTKPGSCCERIQKDGTKISGTCKPKCSINEQMIMSCGGSNCKCCSPVKCQNLGKICGNDKHHGVCKDTCSINEDVIGKCKGASCKCCAIKACRKRNAICGEENKGRCKAKCEGNEEEVGKCPGGSCKCCEIKECKTEGAACGKSGKCRPVCMKDEELVDKCPGGHCFCCQPKVCKDPGPAGCSAQGGVCRTTCEQKNLAPRPWKCEGSGCQCCICKQEIKGPIDPDGRNRENNNHTCPTGKSCDDDGYEGICKVSCESDELASDNEVCSGTSYSADGNDQKQSECVCCTKNEDEVKSLTRTTSTITTTATTTTTATPAPYCKKEGSSCGFYGGAKCKMMCNDGENQVHDPSCGNNCKCCLLPSSCVGTPCGRYNRGECKAECNAYETSRPRLKRCKAYGGGCTCCVPKKIPGCRSAGTACGHYKDGICKAKCNANEDARPNIEDCKVKRGGDCTCCVPHKAPDKSSPTTGVKIACPKTLGQTCGSTAQCFCMVKCREEHQVVMDSKCSNPDPDKPGCSCCCLKPGPCIDNNPKCQDMIAYCETKNDIKILCPKTCGVCKSVCDPVCQNYGQCTARNTCTCSSEWMGDVCETPICDPECQNNGDCTAPNTCTCSNEWMGDVCETPICDPECQNNGECTAPNTCTCSIEWMGDVCETPVCDTECQNNGDCTAPNTCTCSNEWKGYVCETPVCHPDCQNNGDCTAPNTCTCSNGWMGDVCETPVCLNGFTKVGEQCLLALGRASYGYGNDINRNWTAAQAKCRDLGGTLADLQESDLTIVANYLKGLKPNEWVAPLYVGARQYSGSFKWASSRKPVSGWYPGEPNEQGHDNCVYFSPQKAQYWDLECSREYPFLCETNI